jgi:hypothetical protein
MTSDAKFVRSQSAMPTIEVAIAASDATPPQLKGKPRKTRKNSAKPVKYIVIITQSRSTLATVTSDGASSRNGELRLRQRSYFTVSLNRALIAQPPAVARTPQWDGCATHIAKLTCCDISCRTPLPAAAGAGRHRRRRQWCPARFFSLGCIPGRRRRPAGWFGR